jgi:hypothetical protein
MKLVTLKLSTGRKYRVAISTRRNAPLGETSLLTEVVINRLVLDKPNLLDYVVTHEFAHKKQWYGFVIAGLSTFMYLASLVILLLGSAGLAFTGGTDTGWPQLLNWIWASPVLAVTGLLASWFVEYNADADSLRILGRDKVLLAFKESQRLVKPSAISQTLSFLTRPPDGLTLLIFTNIHKTAARRQAPLLRIHYSKSPKRTMLAPTPFQHRARPTSE